MNKRMEIVCVIVSKVRRSPRLVLLVSHSYLFSSLKHRQEIFTACIISDLTAAMILESCSKCKLQCVLKREIEASKANDIPIILSADD